jgi:hypothetical protein
LHVKALDNGGAALSREFRLDGEAARRVEIFGSSI